MGVSAGDLTRITLDNSHTAYKQAYLSAGGCVCVKNYPPEIMQPSSSTRATIVSAENQNCATIVKATFFFCHYYIVWESNNAGEARGQSWSESLKSRWIPGGSCGYTSGTKRKHFAALSSPRPYWTDLLDIFTESAKVYIHCVCEISKRSKPNYRFEDQKIGKTYKNSSSFNTWVTVVKHSWKIASMSSNNRLF